MTGYT